MNINNPYGQSGLWLKGNLHTHTRASPCGHYPLKDVAAIYSGPEMGYDLLAVTDHRILTDVSPVQGMNGLAVFGGTEYKKDRFQTLGINIRSYNDNGEGDLLDHQQIFDDVNSQGGVNIICHPHLYREDYWPLERLLELEGYAAIEIYNHNVKMNGSGRAVATDLWDRLLERGRRVWGVASDDMHHYSRCGGGFIQVLAREKSAGAALEAVRAGSFYASSGVLLKDIGVSGDGVISLAAASARVPGTIFRFIGRGGKVLKEERPAGAEEPASYTVRGDEGYVRAEAFREDGAHAWTQPFRIG
jgi:histidinol phosphatase-like PHP family hydrolase